VGGDREDDDGRPAGARVDRIAQAAAANKQLIYAYFGNKDGLFDAALTHSCTGLMESVPFDPDDIPGYVGRLFDYAVAHPEVYRLVAWAGLERPDAIAEFEAQSYGDKLAAIAEASTRADSTRTSHPRTSSRSSWAWPHHGSAPPRRSADPTRNIPGPPNGSPNSGTPPPRPPDASWATRKPGLRSSRARCAVRCSGATAVLHWGPERVSVALGSISVIAWIEEASAVITAEADHLTQLDAAIGDGDHGVNLARGFRAVRDAVASSGGDNMPPGHLLILAGKTLVATVGGASGPLWGTALRRAGRALGEAPELDGARLADALDAALAGVVELGAAESGDKTMVDALGPAVAALRAAVERGAPLAEALEAAANAAADGARATVPMQARKGRASYLGERSIGHEDPGAASTALIVAALRRALNA
jgi:dihydroxyacetone kinase-like protein